MGSYWQSMTQIARALKDDEYDLNNSVRELMEKWSEKDIRKDQRRYDDLRLDLLIMKNIIDHEIYNLDFGF